MAPRLLLALLAGLVIAVIAACGGGGSQESASESASACGKSSSLNNIVFTPTQSDYFPIVASSDLAVGRNRLVVGLLDKDQAPVNGAQLHFRLFCLTDSGDKLYKSEMDATTITVQKSITHTNPQGQVETVQAGELSSYVAYPTFDSAGKWGVEVSGTVSGQKLDTQAPIFPVEQKSLTPNVGDPAPPSVQPLLKDVGGDITKIDTSDPPDPQMHQITVADAIKSGKPTVIVIATPAFCTSQLCGPTKSIADGLYNRYKDQVNFIHIEPYFLDAARAGKGLCPIPIMNLDYASHPASGCPQIPANQLPPRDQTWNLSTEPWVFIVDKTGKIAARFEAAVSAPELEGALKPLLGS